MWKPESKDLRSIALESFLIMHAIGMMGMVDPFLICETARDLIVGFIATFLRAFPLTKLMSGIGDSTAFKVVPPSGLNEALSGAFYIRVALKVGALFAVFVTGVQTSAPVPASSLLKV